ncbi:sugar ABC transporter substrate-binding protein [Micromonospora yasonensis]|uniref:ABC transporter substrate-binding protein n=1 Tax=Micromonospora yasonensis TaxID=1128667 RepID=UPI002231BB42|nr:sugar ABC transporter substrate-binding protein [Micromonospora yasonensis]MCW3845067.1 sugar ABC transporter substrate-binding protein [Micromonospora yasonensis]
MDTTTSGRRLRLVGRVAAALLVLPLALAACGGNDNNSSSSGGPVKLEFWGWAPGYDKSVELFNASHKDIQVAFNKLPSGAAGGYDKMFSAVKAGNAPCLAQVGFESVPTFLLEGALEDVTAEASTAKGQFVPWTWNQVSVAGRTYAVPVDTGPTALYYRKDVFEKYGIAVPTTWDEYANAAEKLHAADPKAYILNLKSTDLSGLAWQSGAKWFGTEGDAWKVTVNGPETKRVADYWQGLIDKKLVNTTDQGAAWWSSLQSGKVATAIGAVWLHPLIAENAPGAKGKFAVAPMPQWAAGEKKFGNEGGSSTAVLKGCKNKKAAVEFATWMSTNPDSLKNLIKVTGIYPAATAGLQLPEVNSGVDYFGGQNIFEVFAEAAQNTDTSWQWGPVHSQFGADLGEAFGNAYAGKTTLPGAFDAVQQKTVEAMKSKGLKVEG